MSQPHQVYKGTKLDNIIGLSLIYVKFETIKIIANTSKAPCSTASVKPHHTGPGEQYSILPTVVERTT